MTHYDVLIAGYGPTGAVAANLLGAHGLRVLVVDPAVAIYDIPRAVHFDAEVMRVFQALDLSAEIESVAQEGTELAFVNGRGKKIFYQDLREIPRRHHWPNDLFFNQPALESQLRASVSRFPNVEVELGWGLEAFTPSGGPSREGVDAVLRRTDSDERREAHCRYLLAADGASSPARKRLGVGQEDLECDDPWLVVDWILDEGTQFDRCAYQICDPARPATLVPCEGTHIRWEFMLNAEDEIEDIEDEAAVRALIAPHVHRLSAELDPSAGKLIRSKVYNFHALIADTFQSDRVFLLGDAAHQMPPFLGQGMCAGIRDAYNLAWKLAGVVQGDYPPSILETYTSERRPHAREVVQTAVATGAIIQNRNRFAAFFRDRFLLLGKRFPALISHLEFAFGWNLGEGWLDADGAPEQGSPIGQPLPQASLPCPDGTSVLSDDLLGRGFVVVGFDTDPAEFLPEASTYAGPSLETLQLGPTGTADHSGTRLEEWATEQDIRIALIRPDRQVFGVCSTTSDVAAELARLLALLESRVRDTNSPQDAPG